jgi:DNA helicase HerA-like ATPase
MVLRNENQNKPNLLKSLVLFSMNGSPCLASISDVQTSNPYMDIKSKLGIGNMSFIANRGKVPHTEDSNIRMAHLQFLTKLSTDGNREKLMTSPDIGLKVVEADDKTLETFYPLNFPENIAVGRYLEREIVVPLNVKELKSVHCGIFGETGWGKSVLQSFLAATLVRAGCKLLIFDHSGDYSNENTDVNKIFSKLVGKKGKDYTVFSANSIRADHDLLRIKLDDSDFWDETFQTTPDYARRLANEIIDVIERDYPDISDLKRLTEETFFNIIIRIIPNVWSTPAGQQQKIATANRKEMRIKNWFKSDILSYIKRPLSFNDIHDKISTQKAIIIDLSVEKMDDSEKALYVHKIGEMALIEGNKKYPKEKLNLVTIVDEAHIYVPQRIANVQTDYWIERSKKTITEIAKQGRKYGLGLCLADQRITAVDKQAIDMGTYFFGRLKMSGERNHIKEMFGEREADALRTINKYQFLVAGTASPLEDVTAPIAIFDPKKDLDYVEKIHSKNDN